MIAVGTVRRQHKLCSPAWNILGIARGLLMGVELTSDREAKTPANDMAEAVYYRALDRGLSFKITMGNVLTLTPPLVTSDEEMDAALDILEASIASEAD